MRAECCLTACVVGLAGCDTLANYGASLDMEVAGPVLRMDGVINSQSLKAFSAVLEDNPQITSIELGQIDGSRDDDIVAEMGYLIRDMGLATYLGPEAEVYSGGVDLFLGGRDRRIATGAVVGVHEWESGEGRGRDFARTDPIHEPTRGYIEDMLGSDAFYWFTREAASFDTIHVMSRDEILRYGLVTQ